MRKIECVFNLDLQSAEEHDFIIQLCRRAEKSEGDLDNSNHFEASIQSSQLPNSRR